MTSAVMEAKGLGLWQPVLPRALSSFVVRAVLWSPVPGWLAFGLVELGLGPGLGPVCYSGSHSSFLGGFAVY